MGKFYVKDWKKYNNVLKERWSLDLWLTPEVVNKGYHGKHHGKKGQILHILTKPLWSV